MPKWATGYQQTTGFVTDAQLYDGNLANGPIITLPGVAQVAEMSVLLDLGNTPAAPVKKIVFTARLNETFTYKIEYANSLSGPWTQPPGSGGVPGAAGCTAGDLTITWTNTTATTARFWRVSLRNTDSAGCGTSIVGCREIEAQDSSNVHINENPGPTSFTVTPSSQVTYMGVATQDFTITLDAAAPTGGEVLNFGDASAGGTFAPVGSITIAAGASTGTFTYLHPTPGSYTLTVTDVTSSMGAHQVTVDVGGFESYTGANPEDVGAGGLRGLSGTLLADQYNNDAADLQSPTLYQLLAGVLYGGQCTASGLLVTIPADTTYFARQVWKMKFSPKIAVPDGATTALWGCSDGKIRQTSSASTRPDGFDPRTCCLITLAVASGGVAVVDNSVMERGQYADRANARCMANGGLWAPTPDTVPAGVECVVPAGHQVPIYESLTVAGTLTVLGKVRVTA